MVGPWWTMLPDAPRNHGVAESMTFVNELGNEIRAAVVRSTEDALGVFVVLQGPHSVSTNVITWREAEVLHNLLGRSLCARLF